MGAAIPSGARLAPGGRLVRASSEPDLLLTDCRDHWVAPPRDGWIPSGPALSFLINQVALSGWYEIYVYV